MIHYTAPAYIEPITAEILNNYSIINDETARRCLDCIAILQHKHSRNALILRAGAAFYYTGNGKSEAIKALYTDLNDYTRAAETEPGDLDKWKYNEQQRIQDAIRDNLIKIIGG